LGRAPVQEVMMIRSGAPWVVASEAEGSGRGEEEAEKERCGR